MDITPRDIQSRRVEGSGKAVILPDPIRDFTIKAASHPMAVKLSQDLRYVKTGTPLRPGTHGWEINGEHPTAWASSHSEGGELVPAWQQVTIDVHADVFEAGAKYRIDSVDDSGTPQFVEDRDGRYLALAGDQILLVGET